MGAVLLSPRRLPRRYNRRIAPSTRKFVQLRHRRRRQYLLERWIRIFQRLQRKFASIRPSLSRVCAVVGIACVVLGIGLLLFSSLLDLREVRVLRTDPRIDVEQVQRAMAPVFRRHLFFLSSQEVVPLLKKAIPDLQVVSLQKRYPSGIVLHLTLDPIIARLSIEDPSTSAHSAGSGTQVRTSDYLTAQGLYVRYLPSQVPGTPPPLIRIVDWGARPDPWTILMSPEFLLQIREAEQALREQFGQEVTERIVFLRAQEFHLKAKGFTIWFDRKNSLEGDLRRYRLFLKAVGPQAAKNYVDLRLTDKVIFR